MQAAKGPEATMQDYISRLKQEIRDYMEMLEPLESGKLHIGERRAGEAWTDRTQAQIEHVKRTIAMLQSIVDRLEKGEKL